MKIYNEESALTKVVLVIFMATAMCFLVQPVANAKCSYYDKGGGYQHKKSLEDKFYYKARMIMHKGEEAGVSEKVIDEVRDIKYSVKKDLIRKDAEIEVLKIDIDSHLREREVDVDAVNDLINQKYALKKEKALTLVAGYARIKASISEKEWEALKELKKSKSGTHEGSHKK